MFTTKTRERVAVTLSRPALLSGLRANRIFRSYASLVDRHSERLSQMLRRWLYLADTLSTLCEQRQYFVGLWYTSILVPRAHLFRVQRRLNAMSQVPEILPHITCSRLHSALCDMDLDLHCHMTSSINNYVSWPKSHVTTGYWRVSRE